MTRPNSLQNECACADIMTQAPDFEPRLQYYADPVRNPQGLDLKRSNHPVRTRMPGGVAGDGSAESDPPLCRSHRLQRPPSGA